MKVAHYHVLSTVCILWVTVGCATTNRQDYSQFRTEAPKSILVVPVVNRSVDVDAPDYYLSTVTEPLAERGYYVFPVHLVKRLMEDEGLADSNQVHEADPRRLSELFGADAILYVSIERWDARYVVLSTQVTVEFLYTLKSGKTGAPLWSAKYTEVYSPSSSSSGNLIADLISNAVVAAVTKAKPNYLPLTREANSEVVTSKAIGLPAGPYSPKFLEDADIYK